MINDGLPGAALPESEVSEVYSLTLDACAERMAAPVMEVLRHVERGTLDAVRVKTEDGEEVRVSTASLRAYLSRNASDMSPLLPPAVSPLPQDNASFRLLREEIRDFHQTILSSLQLQQEVIRRLSEESRAELTSLREENRLLREMVTALLNRLPASNAEMKPAPTAPLPPGR